MINAITIAGVIMAWCMLGMAFGISYFSTITDNPIQYNPSIFKKLIAMILAGPLYSGFIIVGFFSVKIYEWLLK